MCLKMVVHLCVLTQFLLASIVAHVGTPSVLRLLCGAARLASVLQQEMWVDDVTAVSGVPGTTAFDGWCWPGA
jgi:hypothetical protein